MLAYFTRGVALGFTAGSLPGAPQAYLIGATLRYGWRAGALLACVPFIADIPIILLTVFVLSALPAWVLDVLRVGGGVFMLYIAFSTYHALRAGTAAVGVNAEVETLSLSRIALRMLPIIWLSPGPWLFWSTICAPLLVEAWRVSPAHALAFLVGFYLLLVGIQIALVLVFDRLRRIDPRLTRAMLLVSVALLLIFGISVLVQGVGGLWQAAGTAQA